MRYTTLIDISSMPLYRNVNTRLVYMHLTLRAGYHAEDLDVYARSLRALAADVGITLAAVRHALLLLERAGLVTRVDGGLKVVKYIIPEFPTPRAEQAKKQRAAKKERIVAAAREEEGAAARRQLEQMAAYEASVKDTGKTGLQRFIDSLRERAAAGDKEAAISLRRYEK